jgi:hypothetical protein
MAEENLKSWDMLGNPDPDKPPAAPPPDDIWPFEGGTAWVYYADPDKGLVKPVILSDGFHDEDTKLDVMYHGLNGGTYPFISRLRERGGDLVILGYDDCTVSILDNANVAAACIRKAIEKRHGKAPLAVGGFSMGGLITRYVLAKMENGPVPEDHQTSTYICYDSPHHGAWIPIALQALAHAMTSLPALSAQINSPASRELLWHHIESLPPVGDTDPPTTTPVPGPDPKRTAFLAALTAVGEWPTRPRKIGVANGTGTGTNGVPSGAVALHCTSGGLNGTKLYTQRAGTQALVAELRMLQAANNKDVRVDNQPEVDRAHGGMLGGFGIAAKSLRNALMRVTCDHEDVCFVPTGSALAVTNMNPFENLGADVRNAPSALNAFKCAGQNEDHTLMTEELGSWIIDQLFRPR